MAAARTAPFRLAYGEDRPAAMDACMGARSHGVVASDEEKVMRLRSIFPAILATAWACSTAQAMTDAEIEAKIKAAGYSQIREMPAGKIRTFKAVKDGQERSIIVYSTGHIKELQ